MSDSIDAEAGLVKRVMDGLIDEEMPSPTHKDRHLLIHHIKGDSSNRVVIGQTAKGKSFLSGLLKNETANAS